MHDGTVGLDRSPDNFIVIFEIDDYNFWLSLLGRFLANANVCIGFQGLVVRSAKLCDISASAQGSDLTHELKPIAPGFVMLALAGKVGGMLWLASDSHPTQTYSDINLGQLRNRHCQLQLKHVERERSMQCTCSSSVKRIGKALAMIAGLLDRAHGLE